jgi:hypothetical protein
MSSSPSPTTVHECVSSFLSFSFTSVCFKFLLSKLLGTLIIVGSLIIKVPQIVNIIKSGSVEGLNIGMYLLELAGYTIGWAYCYNQVKKKKKKKINKKIN